MDKKVEYLNFCIETYKEQRNLTSAQAYKIFIKYNFNEYIIDMYELLHIQGTKRLLEELDEYQRSQEIA